MVDDILNYKKTSDDFYKILGCDASATTEQILTEFKIKAKDLHPDKNLQNNKEECTEEFAKLQRAKEVLGNPETRSLYDKWRNSGIAMSYETWLSRMETNNMATHWVCNSGVKQPMLQDSKTKETSERPKNRSQWNENRERSKLAELFRNYEI